MKGAGFRSVPVSVLLCDPLREPRFASAVRCGNTTVTAEDAEDFAEDRRVDQRGVSFNRGFLSASIRVNLRVLSLISES